MIQIIIDYNNAVLGTLKELNTSLSKCSSNASRRLNTLLGISQGLSMFLDHHQPESVLDNLEETTCEDMNELYNEIMYHQHKTTKLVDKMSLEDQDRFMKDLGLRNMKRKSKGD